MELPELCSVEYVLETCPRIDHVVWTRGLSLTCSVSLCLEGRGGRHSGLNSAVFSSPLACLSLTGDGFEAMCSVCAHQDRDMPSSAPEVLSGILYLGVWIRMSHYSGNQS